MRAGESCGRACLHWRLFAGLCIARYCILNNGAVSLHLGTQGDDVSFASPHIHAHATCLDTHACHIWCLFYQTCLQA